LILADEPTGALDSKTGREVMELLSQLNTEQGKTILLITHDAQVASFAKKVVRMMDGVFVS
jgi:putative ABC transport system ATP-binding protein